jgi:hypothetical protein
MSILVDAALKAGAPSDYIEWLRARPSTRRRALAVDLIVTLVARTAFFTIKAPAV